MTLDWAYQIINPPTQGAIAAMAVTFNPSMLPLFDVIVPDMGCPLAVCGPKNN
jgi:hypothetical protein